MPEIAGDIARIMKNYVYVYLDPRDGKPFYVGKGKGNRVFEHLKDPLKSEKVLRIKELRDQGLTPKIDILRYGLSENEALLVEASAIDLLGKGALTNQQAGHHKGSFARINSEDLLILLTAAPVKVKHRALLITINQLFRSDMTPLELYEATRGEWKVGRDREKTDYALAVYQGIVREVYRIKSKSWVPAATLPYQTRDTAKFKRKGRWEFEGEPAEAEVRALYLHKSVGKGGQNPIRYCNIKPVGPAAMAHPRASRRRHRQ